MRKIESKKKQKLQSSELERVVGGADSPNYAGNEWYAFIPNSFGAGSGQKLGCSVGKDGSSISNRVSITTLDANNNITGGWDMIDGTPTQTWANNHGGTTKFKDVYNSYIAPTNGIAWPGWDKPFLKIGRYGMLS